MIQDAVIRATNSQTRLPEGSLRITDPIHHAIEDLFKQADLYYDRRKGHYKDKGKPIVKIVSVVELIQSMVSILLQSPDDARWRPSDYLIKADNYQRTFNDEYPLSIYLQTIKIMRKVQGFTRTIPNLDRGEKFNLKFYFAMLLVCDLTDHTEPNATEIMQIDLDLVNDETIGYAAKRVLAIYTALKQDDEKMKGPDFVKRLKTYIRRSQSQKRAARNKK